MKIFSGNETYPIYEALGIEPLPEKTHVTYRCIPINDKQSCPRLNEECPSDKAHYIFSVDVTNDFENISIVQKLNAVAYFVRTKCDPLTNKRMRKTSIIGPKWQVAPGFYIPRPFMDVHAKDMSTGEISVIENVDATPLNRQIIHMWKAVGKLLARDTPPSDPVFEKGMAELFQLKP